jgi:hypothetical protein
MSTVITKRIVATAQPKERPYELRDAQVRGLLLRVQPSGHKAWIVTWAHGKRRTLGSAGHLNAMPTVELWVGCYRTAVDGAPAPDPMSG